MRLQLSALTTALLLTVLAADLRHAHVAPAHSRQSTQMAQLQPDSDNRGSGRIEVAYRGSGRIEVAYRGSGRLEVAYRGSGRLEVA